MKIKLSPQQAFCLSEVFAQKIHDRVISMHLWTTDHIFHTTASPFAVKDRSNSFNEVCAAIRSIKPGPERRDFVCSIKFHFQKLRAERGTAAKWQDHLAHVKEVNKNIVPTPYI